MWPASAVAATSRRQRPSACTARSLPACYPPWPSRKRVCAFRRSAWKNCATECNCRPKPSLTFHILPTPHRTDHHEKTSLYPTHHKNPPRSSLRNLPQQHPSPSRQPINALDSPGPRPPLAPNGTWLQLPYAMLQPKYPARFAGVYRVLTRSSERATYLNQLVGALPVFFLFR